MTTAVSRVALTGISFVKKTGLTHVQRTVWQNCRSKPYVSIVMSVRHYSDHWVTPNLRLQSSSPIKLESHSGSMPKVSSDSHRPLLLLLEYMNAKEKHVTKFVDFYTEYGFDVLRIHLKPWQLLWPLTGSQVNF